MIKLNLQQIYYIRKCSSRSRLFLPVLWQGCARHCRGAKMFQSLVSWVKMKFDLVHSCESCIEEATS